MARRNRGVPFGKWSKKDPIQKAWDKFPFGKTRQNRRRKLGGGCCLLFVALGVLAVSAGVGAAMAW